MLKRQLIYQSNHLIAVLLEQGSQTVTITFNEVGMLPNGLRFSEDSDLEAIGATAIGIVSTRPNWYPADDMEAVAIIAKRHIAGRRVITFGVGQGGYGALKFAACLSADEAFSFSPQFSIDPADVSSFDRRFIDHYNPALKSGRRLENSDLANVNYILFDGTERSDAVHATRIVRLGNVVTIPMPFSGNASFRQIAQSGNAPQFFQLCLGKTQPRKLRHLIRLARSSSPDYAWNVAARLGKTLSRHKKLYLANVDRMRSVVDQSLALIHLHLATGELVKAKQVLSDLSDQQLNAADLGRVWGIFRSAAFHEGERRIAKLFTTRYPDNVYMRLVGVDSMIHVGWLADATQELQILQRCKGSEAQVSRFIQCYDKLRRYDLTSEYTDRLLEDGFIQRTERLRIGFEIAEACRRHKMRSEVLRELIKLKSLIGTDEKNALRLIEFAVRADQFGFIGDMLLAHPHLSRHYPVVEVYSAQSTLAKDRLRGYRAFEALLARDVPDPTYWEKLSLACEESLGAAKALRAIKRAIALSPKPLSSDLTLRFALLLIHCGRKRRAAREMAKLIDKPDGVGRFAGNLVHLALVIGRTDLARSFATGWVNKHPTETCNVADVIETCRIYLRMREMAPLAATLNALLKRFEAGLSVERGQLQEVIELAQVISFEMEHRAVGLALAQHPKDDYFISLSCKERDRFAHTLRFSMS